MSFFSELFGKGMSKLDVSDLLKDSFKGISKDGNKALKKFAYNNDEWLFDRTNKRMINSQGNKFFNFPDEISSEINKLTSGDNSFSLNKITQFMDERNIYPTSGTYSKDDIKTMFKNRRDLNKSNPDYGNVTHEMLNNRGVAYPNRKNLKSNMSIANYEYNKTGLLDKKQRKRFYGHYNDGVSSKEEMLKKLDDDLNKNLITEKSYDRYKNMIQESNAIDKTPPVIEDLNPSENVDEIIKQPEIKNDIKSNMDAKFKYDNFEAEELETLSESIFSFNGNKEEVEGYLNSLKSNNELSEESLNRMTELMNQSEDLNLLQSDISEEIGNRFERDAANANIKNNNPVDEVKTENIKTDVPIGEAEPIPNNFDYVTPNNKQTFEEGQKQVRKSTSKTVSKESKDMATNFDSYKAKKMLGKYGITGLMNVAFALSDYKESRREGKGPISAAGQAAGTFVLGEALGLKFIPFMLAKNAPELGIKAVEGVFKANRNMNSMSRFQPFGDANFQDTQQLGTMRQAGLEMAKMANYNLQQTIMGNEATYMSR